MRKGLTTLMTVAIILVSAQSVLAYAPMIQQIPSPIVGNKTATTPSPATAYVFPDAFDLNALAIDETTVTQLKWSYEFATTPKYAINGDQPINSLSGNVVNPPAANQINITMNSITSPAAANDPNPDGKINTVTIRDISLYPYGGSPSTSQTGPQWNMQPVTFWCSDGNLASSSTVMFYTDNTYTGGVATGWNRLSAGSAWTLQKQSSFQNASEMWAQYDQLFDHCTTKTWSDGKGVCFEVTQTGQNWGSIQSPMGFVTLTDNMVYRLRAKMNCNQLSGGKTPFWDFILENWNGDAAVSMNLYGMDTYFLDNENSANAIVNKTAGTEVTMIWAPAAFQTQQWRNTTNGVFAANKPVKDGGNGIDYHLQKDAALRFRVLDVDANATLLNNQKFGQICLQSIIVETCPVSRKVYLTGTGSVPAIYKTAAGTFKRVHNDPDDNVPGNTLSTSLTGATISYSGSIVSVTPIGTSRQVDIVEITPAKDVKYEWGNWATIADDWPITWQSGKIYELKAELSAPNSDAADHPWDVIWMNMEPPTNEVITESYVTANTGLAMPKTYSSSAPQYYYMYYYSGNETKSSTPALHFLRWRIRFGNNTLCNWPTPADTLNTGMVQLRNVEVNQVDFR